MHITREHTRAAVQENVQTDTREHTETSKLVRKYYCLPSGEPLFCKDGGVELGLGCVFDGLRTVIRTGNLNNSNPCTSVRSCRSR